ncbi:MAG: FkbM family methyltransferase [Verrucomicrobiae bacterium]|nr:FkbM family methyltransferase [Verrucomicrobiae bacterium]
MFRVLIKVREYHALLGLKQVAGVLLALLLAKLSSKRLSNMWSNLPLFKVRVPRIAHPVQMRFGTSDAWALKEVLLDGEYDFLPAISPKIIIDAGANIGLAAIFFANKFPDALVYALEPEESNFNLLKTNTAPYPQIKPLKTALWNENKQIKLFDSSGGHWGVTTHDVDANPQTQLGQVEAVTLDGLMQKLNVDQVDILKIDIEGAEKEVFENSKKWIGKVQIIMVELHERYRSGCEQAFTEATQEFLPKVVRGQIVMCLHPTLAA